MMYMKKLIWVVALAIGHSVVMYNIDSAQNKVFMAKPDSPGMPEYSVDWKIARQFDFITNYS